MSSEDCNDHLRFNKWSVIKKKLVLKKNLNISFHSYGLWTNSFQDQYAYNPF